MLVKHLINLLNLQKRVIIPELGAFLLKGEDNKSIYFNEFLRFNDGLLVSYIAENENVEVIDAARMIKGFVDDINHKLHSNHSFEIQGIGTLYLDSNEKIQLKTEGDDQVKTSQPSNSDQNAIEDHKQTSSIPAQVPNLIPEKKDLAKSNGQLNPEINEIKSTHEIRFNLLNARVILIIASVLVIVLILAYLLLAHQAKQIKSEKANLSQDTIYKKLDLIKQSDSFTRKNTTPAKVESPNDSVMSAMKLKPPQEASNNTNVLSKPEPVNKNIRKSVSDGKNKYFIVAGCFSDELNANRMVEKLKSEGFNSEKFAIVHNLHYVCYSGFPDKEQANTELKKLKEKGKSEAWIMHSGQ